MNINQIREAIIVQANKLEQLAKEMLQAATEITELEELEKIGKMKYQEKITQAAQLLKEAQLLAGCDQESIINDVVEEINQNNEEEIINNDEPSELELAALNMLKEKLVMFTQLNSELPEEEQIKNKKKLLAAAGYDINEPVISKVDDMKEETREAIPESEQIQNEEASLEILDSQPDPDSKKRIKRSWNDFDNIPIEKLELSNPIHNKLKRIRINSVGRVLQHWLYSRGRTLSVGSKGKEEIKTQLSKIFGIVFDSQSDISITGDIYNKQVDCWA